MLEYKVRPSKYRFLAPLLLSGAAVSFFLPFYLSIVVLCTNFPAIQKCTPDFTIYVWWFFLAMFFVGIAASAYRAYRDFCKGEIRVMRLHR